MARQLRPCPDRRSGHGNHWDDGAQYAACQRNAGRTKKPGGGSTTVGAQRSFLPKARKALDGKAHLRSAKRHSVDVFEGIETGNDVSRELAPLRSGKTLSFPVHRNGAGEVEIVVTPGHQGDSVLDVPEIHAVSRIKLNGRERKVVLQPCIDVETSGAGHRRHRRGLYHYSTPGGSATERAYRVYEMCDEPGNRYGPSKALDPKKLTWQQLDLLDHQWHTSLLVRDAEQECTYMDPTGRGTEDDLGFVIDILKGHGYHGAAR